MSANWARLWWEGWVNSPDGRHGHPPGGVRRADGERKRGERWTDDVHRAVACLPCNHEHQAWDTNPEYTHLVLCFCLTAPPPKKESALYGMKNPLSQEGKFGSAIALPFDQFQLGHMPLTMPLLIH